MQLLKRKLSVPVFWQIFNIFDDAVKVFFRAAEKAEGS